MDYNLNRGSYSIEIGNSININFVNNVNGSIAATNSYNIIDKTNSHTPIKTLLKANHNILTIDGKSVDTEEPDNAYKLGTLDASDTLRVNNIFKDYMSLICTLTPRNVAKTREELYHLKLFLNALTGDRIKKLRTYSPNRVTNIGLVFNGTAHPMYYPDWSMELKVCTCIFFLLTEFEISIVENLDQGLGGDVNSITNLLAETYRHALEDEENYAGYRIIFTVSDSAVSEITYLTEGTLVSLPNGKPFLRKTNYNG